MTVKGYSYRVNEPPSIRRNRRAAPPAVEAETRRRAAKLRRVRGSEEYLDRLASADPTPGGGSAAAVVGATGAALVAMVARITLANPRREAQHAAAKVVVEQADLLRSDLLRARAADETAYAAVANTMALPQATDEERSERATALQDALALAAAEPLRIAELANGVLGLAEQALDLRNRSLVSDVGCAAEFGGAAVSAAALNVRINHRYLKDASFVSRQEADLEALERKARLRVDAIRARVKVEIKRD
jgi:formiminotetrahydrofolate cyclodeaminase